jgi:hypothetical protein
MRFRPRHYALFALLVAVFVYNMVRRHRATVIPSPAAVQVVPSGPKADTPAWRAFDHAASLRDAPAIQFSPALKDVEQQLPNDPGAADIRGCLIWLQFYRQGMAQIRTDPQMKDRSIHHLAGCTQFHLDTSTP